MPPNAPATDAALKKNATLTARSRRLYHIDKKKTTPGKSPPSVMPRKKRTARNPPKFWVTPMRVATMPHASVRVGSQSLGEVRLRTTLEGTSKMTYPTK